MKRVNASSVFMQGNRAKADFYHQGHKGHQGRHKEERIAEPVLGPASGRNRGREAPKPTLVNFFVSLVSFVIESFHFGDASQTRPLFTRLPWVFMSM
jgi:hypothetical protein